MRTRLRLFAVASLLVALSSHAQQQYTITPDHGPVGGGTQVTLKGEFGTWPYALIFGGVGVPATRVDETTLTATTPAHVPGVIPVTLFEYDIGIPTGLTFTFEGNVDDAFERILLPMFVPPISGAYGSEFHTELRATSKSIDWIPLYGLRLACGTLPCDTAVLSTALVGRDDNKFFPNGTPGRFAYVAKDQLYSLSANLRAWDASRDAENFGTELPLVRERDFQNDIFILNGVPTEPRFRNTLRIYSPIETTAYVTLEPGGSPIAVPLRKSNADDIFEPAYGVFTAFPQGSGPGIRVVVSSTNLILPTPPIAPIPLWGFVSVTNNQTQMITTLTPQP